MLMGDDESHPWLSAKASRWMCKFFSDKFVTQLAAYLQRQVVWVYPNLPYRFWDYFVGQLSMVRRFALL
ncbi:hypothetical protein VCSRO163_2177 [Vibrio cholerae]|nr:hypothetical protein VCSRO163_2177 [Vibrio cholerae]